MVRAKCTEKGACQPVYDFCCTEDDAPYIDFELPEGCWPEGYDGAGVFTVDFEDLLKDYLENYWDETHGELTPLMVNLLRKYADKIEQDLKKRREHGRN